MFRIRSSPWARGLLLALSLVLFCAPSVVPYTAVEAQDSSGIDLRLLALTPDDVGSIRPCGEESTSYSAPSGSGEVVSLSQVSASDRQAAGFPPDAVAFMQGGLEEYYWGTNQNDGAIIGQFVFRFPDSASAAAYMQRLRAGEDMKFVGGTSWADMYSGLTEVPPTTPIGDEVLSYRGTTGTYFFLVTRFNTDVMFLNVYTQDQRSCGLVPSSQLLEFLAAKKAEVYGTVQAPVVETPIHEQFMSGSELVGFSVTGSPESSEHPLEIILVWRVVATTNTSYSVAVQLLDANGGVLAQSDAQPANGQRPTAGWVPGEVVVDRHQIPIGEYAGFVSSLTIMLYDPQTGTRVLTTSGADRVKVPISLEGGSTTTTNPAAFTESFDSPFAFLQTSNNVYVADGKVYWNVSRSGGEQYVYHSIPPFSGDVRLTVTGQVNSWDNNCGIQVGIGDAPGHGVAVFFGWIGGGCGGTDPAFPPGAFVSATGMADADFGEGPNACQYWGNWLMIGSNTPYTAELDIFAGLYNLSVPGSSHNIASGNVDYFGTYDTLYVGLTGDGDWPSCSGSIDSITVEPSSTDAFQ